MSTKVEELPKVINWKINLKNGASIDLNVRDGDNYDKSINKWVSELAQKINEFFYGSFEQGDIWISPSEFSMALRSPYRPKAQELNHEFDKIEGNSVE